MTNSGISAGNNTVVDSGSAILGPDEEPLSIKIDNLIFRIYIISNPAAPPINPDRVSDTEMIIKYNTWQVPDPTFRFRVGHVPGGDLYLAVRITSHHNYRLITYTFTKVPS
jgi:hypothetical protein